MKTSSTLRRRLPIEMAALGFLMHGPLHGYDLHHRVEQELGPVWRIGLGHLYNTLKRLEREKPVTSATVLQENCPPRKIYVLTPAGWQALLAWLRQPVPPVRDMRVEFLAKLYFCTPGIADPHALIAAQVALLEKQLAQIEQAWAQAEPGFYRLVLDLRRPQIRAALEWLHATEQTLQEKGR